MKIFVGVIILFCLIDFVYCGVIIPFIPVITRNRSFEDWKDYWFCKPGPLNEVQMHPTVALVIRIIEVLLIVFGIMGFVEGKKIDNYVFTPNFSCSKDMKGVHPADSIIVKLK